MFYAAIFPRLARNTPEARELRRKYESKEVSAEEYEKGESLEKNRISNISTVRVFCRLARFSVSHRCLDCPFPQVHSNIG